MDTISPELVLVDESLADSARATGAPGTNDDSLLSSWSGRTPTSREVARRNELQRAQPPSGSQRSRRARGSLAYGVLLTILVGALAGYLFRAGDSTTVSTTPPALRAGGSENEPGKSGETTPTSGAPQTLRWQPVKNAVFYNVIFWRNGTRALDLWPRAALLRVPARALAPGQYTWFVYPALPEGDGQTYGRVVAHGRLRI